MFEGEGGIVNFFSERMSWPGGIPPSYKKYFKKIKNWKSEREEIERKRRKIKMNVGGGGGMCNYFMQLQCFERG